MVDKNVGFLVNPKDPAAAAEAIAKLATDPNLCLRLGQNSRKRILENYGLDTASRAYLKLLDCEFFINVAARKTKEDKPSMKVAMLDPSLFTPPYDSALWSVLCRNLGVDLTLHTRNVRPSDFSFEVESECRQGFL